MTTNPTEKWRHVRGTPRRIVKVGAGPQPNQLYVLADRGERGYKIYRKRDDHWQMITYGIDISEGIDGRLNLVRSDGTVVWPDCDPSEQNFVAVDLFHGMTL